MPTAEDQFTQLVEDRLDKGFTVYQNYFAGHNSHWWHDSEYACIDPTRFREVMDPMLDQLADRGLVIAQGIGLYSTSVKMPRESLVRLAEYVAARYGAHPLVWFTAQEVNLPGREGKPPRTDLDAWRCSRGEIRSLQRLRASCQRAHVPRQADGLGTGALARLVRIAGRTHQLGGSNP